MASSPKTGSPLENIATTSPSSSPSPPHPQGNPSMTTAAQPDPAPPGHAPLTPPPPPEQDAEKPSDADEPLTPPIDGTGDVAGPPPSPSPQELVASASPALEAASSEEPTSASPPPPSDAAEISPMATAAVASLPPSPQIAEPLPEDAPPPSAPPTVPTTPAPTSGACLDASSTDAVAMASEEDPGPPPAPESTDKDPDPHAAPAPSASPLEGGPEAEGLLPQQQPPLSSLETAPPVCENSETQLLPPPPLLAETANTLPDEVGTDAVTVTSVEAAGSPGALGETNGKTRTTMGVLPELKSEAQGSLQEPVRRPSSSTTESEPRSPEMAPPGFENFKSSWLPLPTCTMPVKSTHSLLDAAATKAAIVVPEEAARSPPASKAMTTDTKTMPSLPMSSSERPLHQPQPKAPSPIAQAEPCSPDTPPPGFENFKSSWLLVPTLPSPAENTYASPDVVATNAGAVAVTRDEATQPVSALEVMGTETDAAQSLLPPLESRVDRLLQQPLLRQSSPMTRSAPCSPEIAPPGFENFKSSWPPLPPLSHAPHVLPHAVATEVLPVTEKAPEAPLALDAMDVDMNSIHPIQPPLERGVEGLLQEPLPRSSSPTMQMQAAPCSPDLAPPGFENFKSSQPLVPSLPLAQTAHTLHDLVITEAVSLTAKAPWATPSLDATETNMDMTSALLPSSESELEGALQQQLNRLPSPMEKSISCSPDIVSSGHENLKSSQLLTQPTLLHQVQAPDALVNVAAKVVIVALEEVCHPPPISSAMEEGTVSILPLSLESGSERSLPQPQVESQVYSPMDKAVDTLPDASTTKSVDVMPEEMIQPAPALRATETSMDSTAAVLPLLESGAEGPLTQPHQQSSSPSECNAQCSLDFLQLLPPPPPHCLDKEMAQLVCGSCRELLAYPRGAAHVQCAGCLTINLVLEAHEVGKVYCGRCETLLMYPSGAPAVKCSLCLFVTEIGERNVCPRISIEQVTSPHPPELAHQF